MRLCIEIIEGGTGAKKVGGYQGPTVGNSLDLVVVIIMPVLARAVGSPRWVQGLRRGRGEGREVGEVR